MSGQVEVDSLREDVAALQTAPLSVVEENVRLKEEVERLKDRIKDEPEWDGTDFAHPAWHRGNDQGCDSIIRRVNEILDGKEVSGTCREPWQTLRLRLVALRDAAKPFELIPFPNTPEWEQFQKSSDDLARVLGMPLENAKELLHSALRIPPIHAGGKSTAPAWLGARIRALRRPPNTKLTIVEVADSCGISLVRMSQIERDDPPVTDEELQKILKAHGLESLPE